MLPHQSGGEVEGIIELQQTLGQAEIPPITWIPVWGSTHGAGTKPWGGPRAVGTQNHAHRGIGGAGSQHRGDTRGLAEKTQLRVKGLAADEAVAGAHPPARQPRAPANPCSTETRDCLGACGAGGSPLLGMCPAPVIYTQTIPIQPLIKRL